MNTANKPSEESNKLNSSILTSQQQFTQILQAIQEKSKEPKAYESNPSQEHAQTAENNLKNNNESATSPFTSLAQFTHTINSMFGENTRTTDSTSFSKHTEVIKNLFKENNNSTDSSLTTLMECNQIIKSFLGENNDTSVAFNNKKKSKNSHKVEVELETSMSAEELAYLTGLSIDECQFFMDTNNIDGDTAFEIIDIFMNALNNNVTVPVEIAAYLNNARIYTKMANHLSAYNTMRGGVKGYGGFVFEELHAANVATEGININVLSNNGPADFIIKDPSGKEILVQAKAGYKAHQIDWSKYYNQTIVVDRGNTVLANEARSAGLTVQESSIFKKQADIIARTQQLESKITGATTAPLTGTIAGMHYAGMASAKLAARVGVSMKIGRNIYDIISGEKTFAEATAEVVSDGIILVGGAYLGGAAFTLAGTLASSVAANTVIGATAATALGTATTTICSTAVGATVVSGIGTLATGAAAFVSSPLVIGGCIFVGALGGLFDDLF